MDRPGWFPDWRNEICVVVASGQSAKTVPLDKLRGRCRVIAVNTSYQLVPWADALYACDGRWWKDHNGVPEFKGLKITYDEKAAKQYGLNRVALLADGDPAANCIVTDRPGYIGRGGNGGFQAINLTTVFGGRRQIWVGIDFYGERWHGTHVNGRGSQRPETLENWRKTLDDQAQVLAALGVSVINCSTHSVLKSYPKMDVETALEKMLAQGF